jgi:hypothetical protein
VAVVRGRVGLLLLLVKDVETRDHGAGHVRHLDVLLARAERPDEVLPVAGMSAPLDMYLYERRIAMEYLTNINDVFKTQILFSIQILKDWMINKRDMQMTLVQKSRCFEEED